MFRRDKESKLDNEGLRRMREAIRQRLETEEGAAGDEGAEELPYRSTTASGSTIPESSYSPPSYEPLTRETDYSFLGGGRSERGVTQVEPPPPPRNEDDPWTVPVPEGPRVTTIAQGTVWHGTLRSTGPIRIEGTFEGEIHTGQDLRIAAEAKVEANVHATSIVVAGQLNGQIVCQERLEVMPSGRVSGQIDAGRFIVHEGAFLGGQVRMKSHSDSSASADDSRPLLQRVR